MIRKWDFSVYEGEDTGTPCVSGKLFLVYPDEEGASGAPISSLLIIDNPSAGAPRPKINLRYLESLVIPKSVHEKMIDTFWKTLFSMDNTENDSKEIEMTLNMLGDQLRAGDPPCYTELLNHGIDDLLRDSFEEDIAAVLARHAPDQYAAVTGGEQALIFLRKLFGHKNLVFKHIEKPVTAQEQAVLAALISQDRSDS